MQLFDGTPGTSVPMLEFTCHRPDLSQPPPKGARRVYISAPRHGHSPLHIQARD